MEHFDSSWEDFDPSAPLDQFRLKVWRQTSSNGDNEHFSEIQRLRLLRRQLEGRSPDRDYSVLPAEESDEKFRWISRAIMSTDLSATRSRGANLDSPIAFEVLYSSLILAAECRRNEKIADINSAEFLTERAQSDLARQLLVQISGQMNEVIYRNFDYFREAKAELKKGGAEDDVIYIEFIEWCVAGGIVEILKQFPPLVDSVGMIIDFWINNTAELIGRIWNDRGSISGAFLDFSDVKIISGFGSLASDRHHCGRVAWWIELNGTKRIVYKPRSLKPESSWCNFITFLVSLGAPDSAGLASVVDRGEYGWMEFVLPTSEAGEEASYLSRIGATLCLLHLLNGNDIHHENLIARNGQPVLVDLETLLHPRHEIALDRSDAHPELSRALALIRNSVAWTGLLPAWTKLLDREHLSTGGLSTEGNQWVKGYRFLYTNTDLMQVSLLDVKVNSHPNVPKILQDHTWDEESSKLVAKGFAAMWDFIYSRKHILLLDPRGLKSFGKSRVRYLLRRTQTYAYVIRRSRALRFLVAAAAWKGSCDLLWRYCEKSDLMDWFPILECESRAIYRGDVPYFYTYAESRDLFGDGSIIYKGAIKETPIESVERNLRMMRKEDRDAQIRFIISSFASERPPHVDKAKSSDNCLPREWDDPKSIIRAAEGIGNNVWDASVDGCGAFWVSLSPVGATGKRQLDITNFSFYSGSSGIAIFFAALYAATGNSIWKRRCLATLKPIMDVISGDFSRSRLVASIGLGGCSGIGGIIYAFSKISKLLGDSTIGRHGEVLLNQIENDAIQSDRFLDIFDGIAGLGLGLSALAFSVDRHNLDFVSLAVRIGEALLAKRDPESGFASWVTMNAPPLASMAHGTSGIALSLWKLGALTSDSRFRSAALKAINQERSLYSSEHGSWFDARTNLKHSSDHSLRWPCRWCHGSVGIGLVRAAMVSEGCGDSTGDELLFAVNHALQDRTEMDDTICCGVFGRSELLLRYFELSKKELYLELSRNIISNSLSCRRRSGGFLIPGGESLNLGFYTGVSGIGFQMLRACQVIPVPSILSWD